MTRALQELSRSERLRELAFPSQRLNKEELTRFPGFRHLCHLDVIEGHSVSQYWHYEYAQLDPSRQLS